MAEDAVALAAAAAKRRRRRRCTAGAGGVDMMSALPADVLQEILSRVGTIKDLFMLAATCRRWLARFTDRTFLRELLCPAPAAAQEGGLLLGFFLQDASFLPAPGGARWSPLTSSLVTADDGDGASLLDDYTTVPLAARRGILLTQHVPHRRGRERYTFAHTQQLHLSVCNPVTGQRHLLAPLDDTNPTDLCCYAIITAADADANANNVGRYTFSQLVVVTVEVSTSDWAVHLHSYTAATRSWSPPATLLLVDGSSYSLVGQRSAVVHHGAAHWLWRRDDGSLYKLSVPLGGAAAACVWFAFTRIPVHGGGNPPLHTVTGDDGNVAAVPYEMDLVDFFMLQLGGLRSAGSSG